MILIFIDEEWEAWEARDAGLRRYKYFIHNETGAAFYPKGVAI